jgi:hypothetical protein
MIVDAAGVVRAMFGKDTLVMLTAAIAAQKIS